MSEPPTLPRTIRAAAVALSVGLLAVFVLEGPSASEPLRVLEFLAVVIVGVALFVTVIAFLAARLGGWREPETEADFDQIVEESERLAREGLAADPDEGEFLELDPYSDADFAEIIGEALDDLPDLLRNSLEHVAVVISDGGHRRGAYGLWEGDATRRGNHPSRIVIYRDTLRRDYGHDPELLRAQIVRTVRHELAHHVGFDEMGVEGLGL